MSCRVCVGAGARPRSSGARRILPGPVDEPRRGGPDDKTNEKAGTPFFWDDESI